MLKNIVANFFGRFWSILSNFLFIPLYINILGFENFSIISFTLILAGIMGILDAGMTATLSREFARRDTSEKKSASVFYTLEKVYLLVVVFVLFFIFIFSEWIVNNWLNVRSDLDLDLVLKIIGFDIAFQMLLKFYMGGLLGAEKQVKANLYQVLWGIFRNAGVVVIIYFSPSLYVFVLWQAFSTIIFAILFRIILMRDVLKIKKFYYNKPFDFNVFRDVGSFVFGMLFISLVSAVSTQLDKLVISRLLPIDELGYYTISVSLAMGLIVIVNPVTTAMLPRLTLLFSTNETQKARGIFLNFNAFTSILVVSLMSVMIVFSKEIIWIWTGNEEIANHSNEVLSIIAVGYGLLAIVSLFYGVCIANGFTKFNNYLGIVSMFLTIPGYILLVQNMGVKGAAIVFSVVQFLITIVYFVLVNNKFLRIKNLLFIFIKVFFMPMIISMLLFKSVHYLLVHYLVFDRFVYVTLISVNVIIVLAFNTFFFISKEQKRLLLSIIKIKKIYAD